LLNQKPIGTFDAPAGMNAQKGTLYAIVSSNENLVLNTRF
jgi:hypothetical protein